MDLSEFLAITYNLFKARKKQRAQGQGAIGFGFASHWLKNSCETKPITKRRNQNRVIIFESFENCFIKIQK